MTTIDPLNRVTRFNWCYCGALQDLWDGEGNKTHWDYDIGGRLLRKTYADATQHNYTYDLAGRLAAITDAKAQVKTHSYYKDGQLAGITYTNSQKPTPNVSFTYDAIYGRLSQMTDGTGSTAYAYHPVDGVTFGAGNLHTIDGPLTNDTIAHTYDLLGRFKSQSINGIGNTTTHSYDALSRVTQVTNPLGTFTHTYDPVNLLPKTVTASNGLITEFSYHPAVGDLRLQQIKHQLGVITPLSSHTYTYSPSGNIKSWAQTTDTSPANTWGISYDRADQLEAATLTNGSGSVIKQSAWRYDKIGNRTSRQNDFKIIKSTYNNRNQIATERPGGSMRVRGTTNETSSVRVRSNANPFTEAITDSGNQFTAWVETTPGQNSITIEAKDTSPNSNTRTNSYNVNIAGPPSLSIRNSDLNGNSTSNSNGNGPENYEWDAENRLIKSSYRNGFSTEFTYDGFSRRIRIIEKEYTTVISDKRYLWAGGNQPAEERDAAGITVLKQYHLQGEITPASLAPLHQLFYTRDHLGSVRELVDANGTLQSRNDYDMWGKRGSSGPRLSDVGYTGHHHHAKSRLMLTWYRVYDADLGRWLSADPMERVTGQMAELLPEGPNLYSYVGADPVNGWDPFGLNDKPKRNLNCNGFDKNSPKEEVKAALDAARRAKNIAAAKQLQALYKTMRSGARFLVPLQAFLNSFEQSFGPLFPEEPCPRFD